MILTLTIVFTVCFVLALFLIYFLTRKLRNSKHTEDEETTNIIQYSQKPSISNRRKTPKKKAKVKFVERNTELKMEDDIQIISEVPVTPSNISNLTDENNIDHSRKPYWLR